MKFLKELSVGIFFFWGGGMWIVFQGREKCFKMENIFIISYVIQDEIFVFIFSALHM